MATRRKTKSKSKSRSRRKSKKKSFFKDQRVRFIIGLILILFAIYSFLAFLSYFFTWQSDFNKGNISFFEFLSSDVVVGNWMGRLGAALAVTFVHKFFGIGAFGLVFIVFLIGMRLINIPIKQNLSKSKFNSNQINADKHKAPNITCFDNYCSHLSLFYYFYF